ncbi:MAG: ATP-binding protein [Candidatus Desulforudis sp.]|nr:ATP-binding protein [Bacillota bacterium]MBV1728160.1 ATP-binding protein [Desulforudis sp.]MBV1734766.1 ATP-binding protein [Desulforudis sp.]MBV1770715.1 ATP-binding protein [Desulforudis sp.]
MRSTLFPLGHPVPEEDLVGRLSFVDALVSRLEEGSSTMLAGPRRIGKTSLAKEALRRLKEKGHYTVWIDCFAIRDKEHLTEKIMEACLANRTGMPKTLAAVRERIRQLGPIPVSLKLQDFEMDISLFANRKATPDELLDQALEFPQKLAERDNRRIIIAFDEFQDVPIVAENTIFKRMRAAFQEQSRATFLFLGSKESMMQTLFSSSREAFYRFAVPLPVPSVPSDSWIQYIQQKFASRKVHVDTSIARELVELTGGHPYDTMLLCNEAYQLVAVDRRDVVTLPVLQQAYDQAQTILEPAFTEILGGLGRSALMRDVLCKLATDQQPYKSKQHSNAVARSISKLEEKGIIEKVTRGQYRFTESMFKDFIIRLFAC